MKIQSINRIYFPTYKKASFEEKKEVNFCAKKENKNPKEKISIKEILFKKAFEEVYFMEFLDKKGKLTKEEISEIFKKHPLTLIQSCKIAEMNEEKIKTAPETFAKSALNLKRYFDKKYKDYTIVSVGTSPAIFTEQMQLLGSDIIFLPITGLREEYEEYTGRNILKPGRPKELKYSNLQRCLNYLSAKGLGEFTRKDNKKIIILDYMSTGNTAYNVKRLLWEFNKIPHEDMKVVSLVECLEKTSKMEDEGFYKLTDEEIRNIRDDLLYSRLSPLCNVPHFNIEDDDTMIGNIVGGRKTNYRVFKEFKDFSRPQARAYSLCIFNEIRKLKQKKSDKKPD